MYYLIEIILFIFIIKCNNFAYIIKNLQFKYKKGEIVMNKVVLVGCGNVGMSYAYNIVTTTNSVRELVLIDVRKEKAEGEALDLLHAAAYSNANIKIKAGTYADCDDATIVCICAGRNQEVGETRQDLIDKNEAVFHSIISEINKTRVHTWFCSNNPHFIGLGFGTVALLPHYRGRVVPFLLCHSCYTSSSRLFEIILFLSP